MTEWKKVEGGKISNRGEVVADSVQAGGVTYFNAPFVPSTDKKGFLIAWLRKNKSKKYRTFHVHREVARLYVPNPEKLAYVDFKDGEKSNVTPENLFWTSKRPASFTGKVTKSDAAMLRSEWDKIKERGGTMGELADLYDVSQSYISRILSGARR